jgi:hypothetical protein
MPAMKNPSMKSKKSRSAISTCAADGRMGIRDFNSYKM